ncbi:hypothetical protein JCGZ_01179 [Jatropha curcas]|uniref:Uncharacterized protein n=1 Tax=Jatropha curcas TaxID=180498 RepID=A0A067JGW6_JATCU|nr:hypothetical protein JCGZ_01179 [Jatropha curcas]
MPSLYGFEANINVSSLSRGRAWGFAWRYAHNTSDVLVFWQLLNSLTWDQYPWGQVAEYLDFIHVAMGYQQRWLLLPGLFYDMYYLEERLEQDITAGWRGSATTNHLAAFMPGAYVIFMRTQLLVHIPSPSEFDPFAEAEELDRGQGDAPAQRPQRSKRVRSDSDSEALDTTVVVGKLEHGPVPLSLSFWSARGSLNKAC